MTDDLMDARLRAAGESWRSANTAFAHVPGEPAEELLVGPQHHSRRGRWLTAASAAVVAAALIVGGVVLLNGSRDHSTKPPATESFSTLTGQRWVLSDGQATLVFAPGRVTIDDPCNTVSRHVQITAGELTFGSYVGVQAGCAQPTDRAKQIAGILTGTVTWSVRDNKLTVTQAKSATISGTLTFATSSAAVLDVTWQLATFVDDAGHKATIDPKATFTIASNSRLAGSDGCNTISARSTSVAWPPPRWRAARPLRPRPTSLRC